MTDVERFQASRTYLAGVYADTAAKLAETAKTSPAANLWGEMATGDRRVVPGPALGGLPLMDFDRCMFGRYLPNATLPPGTTITIDFDVEALDWTALLADLNKRFKLRR